MGYKIYMISIFTDMKNYTRDLYGEFEIIFLVSDIWCYSIPDAVEITGITYIINNNGHENIERPY
jgi:hypothetical protein